MDTNKLYHYVYRITNVVENKHYYGKRSSTVDPKLDLGVKYFSSSSDKKFIEDQKIYPERFKYKVVSVYNNSFSAIQKEVVLHNRFDVGVNPKFYNKSKQTSTKFDTTGIMLTEEQKHKVKNRKRGPMSEEQKAKLSKAHKGKKHSTEARIKMSNSHKGKKLTAEHVKKIKAASTGKKHSPQSIEKMKKAQSGLNHPGAKPVNIYASTGELVAENVCLKRWAKDNNYNQGCLWLTLKRDLSKPSTSKNPHLHKGLYAAYN